jgi:ketosteroid isomerase-like protein
MSNHELLLRRLYERFNARDTEELLATMQPDVLWANGMEGGYVHGRDAVRNYWTRQWSLVDPRVEPIGFSVDEDGAIEVKVHQVVRDRKGHVLADKVVGHVFHIEEGLIRRFDIQ